MSRVSFKGWDQLEGTLENIADKTEGICKKMVYSGAGTIADAVRGSLRSVVSDNATGKLANSLDIRPIKANSRAKVFTTVTFDGYDDNGTPFALEAAVLESGRSDQPENPGERNKYGHILKGRKATHFHSKAVNAAKGQAQANMAAEFNKSINQLTKGAE